jgi:transposase
MCNQERLDAYKKRGITFANYGTPLNKNLPKGEQKVGEPQSNCVKYIKEIFPEYSDINYRVFHTTIKALDTAWKKGNKTLYMLEHLNDPDFGKKKNNKESNEPTISIIRENTSNTLRFDKHIKGAHLRRKLPENNPYVNTNRLEDLKFIPRYKSQNDRQTFTLTDSGWRLDTNNQTLFLTMGKEVKARINFRLYRPIKGEIKTVSITHDNTHKWWVTFSCVNVPGVQREDHKPCSVGIDPGVINVLADSDGRIVPNPTFLIKSSATIAKAQQRLDMFKEDKASKKYLQAKKWLARAHEKIANQRKYFARQLAKEYTDKYDTIYFEDISLVDISRRRITEELKLDATSRGANKAKNRKTLDAGIGIIRDQIINTAQAKGVTVVMVPAFNTTQTCSKCGDMRKKGDTLKLSDRTYVCRRCGNEMDRDINAAIVIKQRGEGMIAKKEAA